MRVVVTGGNGFVGRYLVAALRKRGDDVSVVGHSHSFGDVDTNADLLDGEKISRALADARPHLIFHLAAVSFVPEANREPMEAYRTNILGSAQLFESARTTFTPTDRPRIVYVSSAEAYGPRPASEYPLRETAVLRPSTPYAASKVAAEAIAMASFRTFGTRTIVCRPFNIIGPGQDQRFAIPAFANQVADIARGGAAVLQVGNLNAKRDFLDVLDVVEAYVAIAERGVDGEAYNVCSGRAVPMSDILRRLITIAGVAMEIREDPERMRPSDNPLAVGDNTKVREATGWQPSISLDASLRAVYEAAVVDVGAHA